MEAHSVAKNRLLKLAKRAGQDRDKFPPLHGEPAELLLPVGPEPADAAVAERMLARREQDGPTLGDGLTIRGLIEEGRR